MNLPASLTKSWLTKSRIKKLVLAKPALAGGLALLLAGEFLLPGPDAAPGGVTQMVRVSAPVQNNDAAVAAWGGTVLARPLFTASRRPVAEASTQTDFTMPRLSAIIVIGAMRRAIFVAPGQKPMMVSEGGEIGPYRITAIAPNNVRLLGADGNVMLRPQAEPPTQLAAAGSNS